MMILLSLHNDNLIYFKLYRILLFDGTHKQMLVSLPLRAARIS